MSSIPKLDLHNMTMPNLPGYSKGNRAEAKAKSAGFQYVNGIRMNPKEDGGSDVFECMTHRVEGSERWVSTARDIGARTSREHQAATGLPEVHRWFAYFKEGVNESSAESQRTRNVVIMYYEADGTMEINEPKVLNSGIPQGCFLNRGSFGGINMEDFQIGAQISVFGRAFKIYDADDNTVRKYGLTRDPKLASSATDKYTEERLEIARRAGGDTSRNFGKRNSALKSFMEASLGNSMQRGSNTRSERKAQFLQNTGKVLSFTCEHDDTANLYGDRKTYTLNYYLADDTVEIKESRSANSGCDPFPLLLKRQKLPQNWMEEGTNDRDRGVEEDCTYDVYVTPDDIQIGDRVTVYGRSLELVDCDGFTRAWYKANPQMLPAGWTEQPAACRYVAPLEEMPTAPPAPYNGYGTEQDSLGSCTHLIPKVPKKDFAKFMGHSTTILRFKAKFKAGSCKREHSDREFIIAYYPSDDTQSIFEQGQRNSGIVSGKFLERGSWKNAATGKPYAIEDFKVGADVQFNSHKFTLEAIDEYTKNSGLV